MATSGSGVLRPLKRKFGCRPQLWRSAGMCGVMEPARVLAYMASSSNSAHLHPPGTQPFRTWLLLFLSSFPNTKPSVRLRPACPASLPGSVMGTGEASYLSLAPCIAVRFCVSFSLWRSGFLIRNMGIIVVSTAKILNRLTVIQFSKDSFKAKYWRNRSP